MDLIEKRIEYFRYSDSNGQMATFTPWGYDAGNMTAIVLTYTPDGFIVGADGLRVGSDKQTVVSDRAQKLFPFQTTDTQLIYGWSGTTQFFGHDGERLFDFLAQTQPLLTMASLYASTDFVAFLHLIRTSLYTLLGQSKLVKGNESFSLSLEGQVAQLLLVGYFKQEPCVADISVDIQNGILMMPVVKRVSLPLHGLRDVFSGSKRAFEGFKNIYPKNQAEAINFVRGYIQACVENPDPSQIYGGCIHVAELTPNGFRWIDAPEISN